MRLEKGEIHKDIPECGVEAVYQRESNEEGQILLRILDAVDAQECTSKDTCRVFPAIDEVRKNIFGVSITSDTLQKTPGWTFSMFEVLNGLQSILGLTKSVAGRRRSPGAGNDWSCNLPGCPSCLHKDKRIIQYSKAIRWELAQVRWGDMLYLHTSHTSGSSTYLPGKSHETRRGISLPRKDATVRCADVSKCSDVSRARERGLMKQY